MPIYCDSKELERNWFNWLLADGVPELERYRSYGVLYTKIIGKVQPKPDGPIFSNPNHPQRQHCLVLPQRVFIESYRGRLHKPVVFNGSRARPVKMPEVPVVPDAQSIEHVIANGYIIEVPAEASWIKMLTDIRKICEGITSRFNIRGDENRADLASEAFVQVTNKIKTKKLVYTPGRAPVFNLLTTTIHRVVYSILNRSSKLNKHAANLRQNINSLAASDCRKVTVASQRPARLFDRLPR